MKRKTTVLSMILILLIIILNVALCFAGCSDASKKYHDIDIYIHQTYHDIDALGEYVYRSGSGADYFLPKYEEIEYNYSDIDFYIFDGTATLTRTAVTFVLDSKFDDEAEYETAKQNELSTREFMTEYKDKKWFDRRPVFEFTLGDFLCKTVNGNGYPRRVRLICMNDSSFILRYLIFEEWEAPERIQSPDYIKSCSNCPWTF